MKEIISIPLTCLALAVWVGLGFWLIISWNNYSDRVAGNRELSFVMSATGTVFVISTFLILPVGVIIKYTPAP